MTNKNGLVYLVGAGSGDPSLITLKGLNLIKECDVLIYDSLIDNSLLGEAKNGCKKIFVGKRAGLHYLPQEEISALIVQEAKKGAVVVRLKGGDPFVFGRGGEEIVALQKENIPYLVVPGISSAISVPQSAGIPLTHRQLSRSFTVVTGHTLDNKNGEDFETLSRLKGTIVFLMGLSNLQNIVEQLLATGKNPHTHCAIICGGTTPKETVVKGTLNNIVKKSQTEKVFSPAIIVVGDVCNLDFSGTIKNPLDKTTVTVTGTDLFTAKLSSQLRHIGATVYPMALSNICETANCGELDAFLKDIKTYACIAFTSTNAVKIFFNHLKALSMDVRTLAHLKFAVIGKGTATALLNYGIIADIMPQQFTAQALGIVLSKTFTKGEKILIPRAVKGSSLLTDPLKNYTDIKIYDVLPKKDVFYEKDTDFITFASQSGVINFFDELKLTISPLTTAVAIGDVTATALKNHGVTNFITANDFTCQGITDKIITEVKNRCKD